ncbi:hypothetical protein BE08_16515 [Sorangium cellulosum]|uniref:Uncharacterized protein n=1 Tax=Sorangium cellulosum TaxID=56 RepID=A0A150PJU1_SORCE|nr:hypothetical protein BE08_16515 [Sorangium cellulosum]
MARGAGGTGGIDETERGALLAEPSGEALGAGSWSADLAARALSGPALPIRLMTRTLFDTGTPSGVRGSDSIRGRS